MHIDFLLDRMKEANDATAIVWNGKSFSYRALVENIALWTRRLAERTIPKGATVSVHSDFSPNSVALLLALIEHNAIVVPLTESLGSSVKEYEDIANVEHSITIDVGTDEWSIAKREAHPENHNLVQALKQGGKPGLVVFSSGSSGKTKATLHDFTKLLRKFEVQRPTRVTLAFLLFDHLGGINTILHILSNKGCLVTVQKRQPEPVCEAIEKYKVQILPTSPTFLSLMMLSEAYKNYDLSSLEKITYGTEPMPEFTLKRLVEVFPKISLQQTYGLSEVGVLRTRSKASDSLWVKVGGEGFQTRVVDGLLEIRADSAMLGYLNAPSPFTEDGWMRTYDAVEVDGDYIKILGRRSEMINVGGAKVYPAEVESLILEMEGVDDVTVRGETHPITGQIVVADIKLKTTESPLEFKKRMHAFLRGRVESFKIPQRCKLVSHELYSRRIKKQRFHEASL